MPKPAGRVVQALRSGLRALLAPRNRTLLVVLSAALSTLLVIVLVNVLPTDRPGPTPSTHAAAESVRGGSAAPTPAHSTPSDGANSHRGTKGTGKGKDKGDRTPARGKRVDWRSPSQSVPYPDPLAHPDLELDVSIGDQRVYVRAGGKTLYTMYASTGMDGSTPRGTFEIEAERGDYFFNSQEGMGARYYTSFNRHGVFLFHTVPTDSRGNYIDSEADLLGRRPSSHGCVRLTIPDAKWIMDKIPTGTKVVIS
ncbi:L,D-transpeptidase [Bifidobacterium favimelis]|uniref:L,D-transpeptidase n=1 Tax=Bifidobacterium favimelis TaxID=3122979 RepID=A0ABU8ZMP3_9BIFI